MKKPGVCVGGYAGCGNLGDDAILTVFIDRLVRNGVPRSQIVALTGRPRRDRRRFGVRCANRMNPLSVFLALRRSPLFVCGGGSLLQNRTGNRSLAYYLFLLRLARLLGCRTVCLGGVGPLDGSLARRCVAAELNRCARVFLRDSDSADLLRKIGVCSPPIRVGADPAFLFPAPPPLRSSFLRHILLSNDPRPFFCVCLRKGTPVPALPAALSRLSLSLGCYRVDVITDLKKDVFCTHATQISPCKAVFYPRDVSEMVALLSSACLVISSRLHPLILSVSSSVPCLGIADSDPKIPSFCRSVGVPVLPASASPNSFFAACASRVSLPARNRPNPSPFRKKAEKDLAILSKMVYN